MVDNKVAYRKIRRGYKRICKFRYYLNDETIIEIWYNGTKAYRVTLYKGIPMVIEKEPVFDYIVKTYGGTL